MRWFTLPTLLVLPLLLSACMRTAAGPASAADSVGGPPAAALVPAPAQPQAGQTWQKPEIVAPLAAEGNFGVIAENPWPGQKVRVFFFGVQG